MIRIELNMNCQTVVYQNNQRLISQTEIISRNFSNPMACQATTSKYNSLRMQHSPRTDGEVYFCYQFGLLAKYKQQ